MTELYFDSAKKIDGVYYLSEPENQDFDENTYISLRKKEGRIYTDETLKQLPKIILNYKLEKEWKIRKKSFDRLIRYFSEKQESKILEIGCGNGWLSNGLAERTNNLVFGLDLNQLELKQAARVFSSNSKLEFLYGNIFEDIFPEEFFDFIIFPSSIQYFENLLSLINRALYFLKSNGEIHILDSHFYDDVEVEKAKRRSKEYYNKLGFPKMANQYFHHKWNELKGFSYKILNSKSLLWTMAKKILVGQKGTFFPWIMIKK